MRPHRLPHQAPSKLITAALVIILFPIVVFNLTIKFIMLGIALLSPADWTEEEDKLLGKAIWHCYRPDQLVFTFWRLSRDIEARAIELGFITAASEDT